MVTLFWKISKNLLVIQINTQKHFFNFDFGSEITVQALNLSTLQKSQIRTPRFCTSDLQEQRVKRRRQNIESILWVHRHTDNRKMVRGYTKCCLSTVGIRVYRQQESVEGYTKKNMCSLIRFRGHSAEATLEFNSGSVKTIQVC